MRSLHKNMHLMLEFLKAPSWSYIFLTLMTFLMMLFVILLSMQMILLSSLTVIRYLNCGNNNDWLLNLNLIYKTLWTGAGSSYFFNCSLAATWPALGHYRGGSLNHPMLLNAFYIFDLKVNGNLITRLDP